MASSFRGHLGYRSYIILCLSFVSYGNFRRSRAISALMPYQAQIQDSLRHCLRTWILRSDSAHCNFSRGGAQWQHRRPGKLTKTWSNSNQPRSRFMTLKHIEAPHITKLYTITKWMFRRSLLKLHMLHMI